MMDVVQLVWVTLWATLTEMAPFLLLGFAVAGVLSVFLSPETVERHLGGKGFAPIVKAALFGIPLPLCSCGVIPVAASLRRHGASRGATTSFLISTPQTGVDSVMVTYSLLGPVFAVFRPLAAFVSGVLGGWMTDRVSGARGENGLSGKPPACTDACCSGEHKGSRVLSALRHGFVTLPRDIGRSMLVGLLVAGLIAAIVPDDFFAGALGHGPFAMLAMIALGIPLYVCATASVPIAVALIAKGVSPGAALVFLMTGPATNAAAITTIWRVLGGRATVSYLAAVALTAIGSGLVLDALFSVQVAAGLHAAHGMAPPWVGTVSAVALLIVITHALLRPEAGNPHPSGCDAEG